jgi:hypothetical protein
MSARAYSLKQHFSRLDIPQIFANGIRVKLKSWMSLHLRVAYLDYLATLNA